jgi:hypothetical protein
MAAVNALKTWEVVPNSGLKTVVICVANTTDAADTLAVTLSTHGISANGLLMVEGWKHTTDGSVIVAEDPTTSVTSGVLTITVPAGTNDDFRIYRLTGRGDVGAFA